MTGLTDSRVKQMLREAQQQDAAPAMQVPMVEHHISGQVNVGDLATADGQQLKVILVTHPSGHQWIIKLPLAAAQSVAKDLQKPPRVPNGVL
jgi:hypothetical protein